MCDSSVLDTLITLHVTVEHTHKCTHRGTNTTRESQRAGKSQKDKNNQKEEWKEALAERQKWSEKQTSLFVSMLEDNSLFRLPFPSVSSFFFP